MKIFKISLLNYGFFITLFIVCLFFFIENVYSQKIEEPTPLTITANQVEIDNKNKIALYSGNVFISKGDLSIKAPQVEIHFGEEEDKIDLIKATGGVYIIWKEYEAKAQTGLYYQNKQEIKLTGNPVVKQGENWLKGENIIYFLDQERVIIKGSVETIIDKQNKNFSYEGKH